MKAIDLLLNRQSNPHLTSPAPDQSQINQLLTAGMKVPDHGCLKPWHFTVVKDQGLSKLSDIFVQASSDTVTDEAKLTKIKNMPFRAPLIIVVSTKLTAHNKVPAQEQVVAAGCAVHAMQMAAVSLGYGAMWRTGDLSYNAAVKAALSISENDEIVGFLYVGTVAKTLPEKQVKNLDEHVSYL